MNIEEVEIEKLIPDPDQPRTTFDPDRVTEMAQSMATEGVINPVEVDPHYMIITGEMRWRAAKEAKLKTIPVKILEINREERFRRQVIENIHHNTMSTWDTAIALSKLMRPPGGQELSVSELAEKVGKSKQWMSDMLGLLEEEGEVTDYLKSPKSKYSLIREVNRYAPAEVKPLIKKKIVDGSLNDRETTNELIRAVRKRPDKTGELLAEDYGDTRSGENIVKIHQIAPLNETPAQSVTDESKLISSLSQLLHYFKSIDPSTIEKDHIAELWAEALILGNNFFKEDSVIQGEEVHQLDN